MCVAPALPRLNRINIPRRDAKRADFLGSISLCAQYLCEENRGGMAMSYNKGLAEWLREVLVDMPDFAERKMFGDLRLMLSGNMCCGIIDEALMTRALVSSSASIVAAPPVVVALPWTLLLDICWIFFTTLVKVAAISFASPYCR